MDLSDHIEIKEIYLKSAPVGNEVLDRSEIEKHQFKGIKINEFKELIDSSVNLNNMDIYSLLNIIASNEEISSDVIDEALKRIEQVQIDGADFVWFI